MSDGSGKKVYEQVDGCMEKDGGPVIGIQIENEYGHVGGLQGPEGEAHIRTLTAIAKEVALMCRCTRRPVGAEPASRSASGHGRLL